MKALIINSQGHSEEAFALAKVALTSDMKSHVCWHVYGLLYRSAKNFEEAIKAYKFALKLEPESQQIQRDLALLQMQMRDYQGYLQSRHAILQARSGLRQNWTALAIAQHLAGNLADAERTLSTYEETLRSPPPKGDIEHSEAVLYKNTIIAEMGETERALDHLDAVWKHNLDRTSVMELRAQYLLRLGRKEEAERAYRELLGRNAEYRSYYEGLEGALGIDKTDAKALWQVYKEYAERNPRGDAARRIPLDFLEGDDFREAADHYLQRMLHKGVPSTFANIKALYKNTQKRDVIQELVEGYANGVHKPLTNGSAEKQVNGETNSEKESSFASSALYFLAQHYNYHLSRDLTKAMNAINRAIELSPDTVDFHMTKARIWKHHGNSQKASDTMEKARSLDERDRYINTKAAKYQLRNNEHDAALKTMSKFTRNETAGGPLGDLHDMQCMWYVTEDGEAYMRQSRLGLALKRFTSIYNIFDIWQEDQFDFHSFSLRKGQIRAYVDMVRWEDHLRQHPFYSRVAIAAVKAYVLLHDKPQLAHGSLSNGVNGSADLESLANSERKKMMKKARKDQQKQEKLDAEKKDAQRTSKAGVGADGEPKKEDPDPEGISLVKTAEPLKDAMKFLTPLLEFSPKNIEAQNVGFEVYFRRSEPLSSNDYPSDQSTNVEAEKYLLALRCLLAGSSANPSDPTTHEQTIRLRNTLSTLPSPLAAQVSEVINAEISPLIANDTTDLSAHNVSFLETHSSSAPHILAGLRARQYLDSKTLEQNQRDVHQMLDLESASLENAIAGLELLIEWNSPPIAQQAYLERARERWPEATVFQPVQE